MGDVLCEGAASLPVADVIERRLREGDTLPLQRLFLGEVPPLSLLVLISTSLIRLRSCAISATGEVRRNGRPVPHPFGSLLLEFVACENPSQDANSQDRSKAKTLRHAWVLGLGPKNEKESSSSSLGRREIPHLDATKLPRFNRFASEMQCGPNSNAKWASAITCSSNFFL